MLTLALLLAGILLICALLVWILGIRLQVVPVEERLVIYRNGRPHRLGGPGWTWLLTRIEEVMRTLNVREQPNEVMISGLNFAGVPFGYKLNIRYKIDPDASAANRGEFLKLLQFEDHEFHRQVQITVRDSLLKIVAAYAAEQNFAPTTPIAAKFAFIRAGTEGANLILSRLQSELDQKLPALGVVINRAYPLMITQFMPDEGMMENLKRERDVDSIRRQWSDLAPELQAQMFASVKDIDLPQVQKHIVESGTGVKVEMRMDDDGTQVRVKPQLDAPSIPVVPVQAPATVESATVQPTPVQLTSAEATPIQPVQTQSSETQVTPVPPVVQSEPVQRPPISDPMRLSKEDLSVLKLVPPYREDRRQAA